MKITAIGVDLAKNVFQIHGVDERGKPVLRKQLKRADVAKFFGNLPPCLIGMEACGSAHHWARKLMGFGHTVKLMAPAVREAVREDEQERCTRCGGDLRGGAATQYEVPGRPYMAKPAISVTAGIGPRASRPNRPASVANTASSSPMAMPAP